MPHKKDSNIINLSDRRFLRIEDSIVKNGVFSEENYSLFAIEDLMADTEFAGKDRLLPELCAKLKTLYKRMRDSSIVPPHSRRDIVLWVVCEILETEVGFDELYDWLRHEATLDEIILGDDHGSIISLILAKGESSKARLDFLLKRHLT